MLQKEKDVLGERIVSALSRRAENPPYRKGEEKPT